MLVTAFPEAKIGIIGAGIAGLSCADELVALGHSVQLFDKGHGPGGRMSTRRLETSMGDVHFDHGAQYFTVRDSAFHDVVKKWEANGVVKGWPLIAPDAWVGSPSMNAVIREMVSQPDVMFGALVKSISKSDEGWLVATPEGLHGPYDSIIMAIPSEQAAPLLALHDLTFAQKAMHARSQPCWTVMLAFAEPLSMRDDILKDLGIISWAARNSAKPGRTGPEAWVVQASGQWSAAHVEDDREDVLATISRQFEEAIGEPLPALLGSDVHRWRFALSAGLGLGALWNEKLALGVCGDWLVGPRVECAWQSGGIAARLAAASIAQSSAGRMVARDALEQALSTAA